LARISEIGLGLKLETLVAKGDAFNEQEKVFFWRTEPMLGCASQTREADRNLDIKSTRLPYALRARQVYDLFLADILDYLLAVCELVALEVLIWHAQKSWAKVAGPCSFSWASTAAAPPCAHLGTCLKQTSDEKTLKLARRRTHTERCLPERSNPRDW